MFAWEAARVATLRGKVLGWLLALQLGVQPGGQRPGAGGGGGPRPAETRPRECHARESRHSTRSPPEGAEGRGGGPSVVKKRLLYVISTLEFRSLLLRVLPQPS